MKDYICGTLTGDSSRPWLGPDTSRTPGFSVTPPLMQVVTPTEGGYAQHSWAPSIRDTCPPDPPPVTF